MLSAPPRPSTETGPRGQGPLTRSIPTSIASELLRGLGLHSVHVQTSTSIDSSASTLRLRTRVTTGPQSRSAGLALTDTLSSEDRWRSGTAPTSWLSSVRMRPSERGWSSRTESLTGRCRSGGPG